MLRGGDNMDIIAMQMQFQGLVGGPVDANFFAFRNANSPPVRNYLAAVNIQIDNKAISRRRQACVGDQRWADRGQA